jgi:hypothetical protein
MTALQRDVIMMLYLKEASFLQHTNYYLLHTPYLTSCTLFIDQTVQLTKNYSNFVHETVLGNSSKRLVVNKTGTNVPAVNLIT